MIPSAPLRAAAAEAAQEGGGGRQAPLEAALRRGAGGAALGPAEPQLPGDLREDVPAADRRRSAVRAPPAAATLCCGSHHSSVCVCRVLDVIDFYEAERRRLMEELR